MKKLILTLLALCTILTVACINVSAEIYDKYGFNLYFGCVNLRDGYVSEDDYTDIYDEKELPEEFCEGYYNFARDYIYLTKDKKWMILSSKGIGTLEHIKDVKYNDSDDFSKENALLVTAENYYSVPDTDIDRDLDNNSQWVGCKLDKWLTNNVYNNLSSVERAAVLKVYMNLPAAEARELGTDVSQGRINGYIYPISIQECNALMSNSDYVYDPETGEKLLSPEGRAYSEPDYTFKPIGYTGEYSRPDYGIEYMLFSRAISPFNPIMVTKTGTFTPMIPNLYNTVRPTFNIDKQKILFTSPAVGGKTGTNDISKDDIGKLNEIKRKLSRTREYKLTLLDDNMNFKVDSSYQSGDTLVVSYSGATVKENSYISVAIKNSFGVPCYYGLIQKPESSSGRAVIKLPALTASNSVYIYNEELNGDYNTDYASAVTKLSFSTDYSVDERECIVLLENGEKDGEFFGHTFSEAFEYCEKSDSPRTIKLCDNADCNTAFLHNNMTVDLNGYALSRLGELFIENGSKITDSTNGKGILKLASNSFICTSLNQTENKLPLYDSQNGGYRFFDYEIKAGYLENSTGNEKIIGTSLKFTDENTEETAKGILADEGNRMSIDISISETDENGVKHTEISAVPQSMLSELAKDMTKPLLFSADRISSNAKISVNYNLSEFLSLNYEIQNASPYLTFDVDADKNYIVNVYGTELKGTVIIGVYEGKDSPMLVNVELKNLATLSGTLYKQGDTASAMWLDLDTVTPYCKEQTKTLEP